MTNIIDFTTKQGVNTDDNTDTVNALAAYMSAGLRYVSTDDNPEETQRPALESYIGVLIDEDGGMVVDMFGMSRLEGAGYLEIAKLNLLSRDPDYED